MLVWGRGDCSHQGCGWPGSAMVPTCSPGLHLEEGRAALPGPHGHSPAGSTGLSQGSLHRDLGAVGGAPGVPVQPPRTVPAQTGRLCLTFIYHMNYRLYLGLSLCARGASAELALCRAVAQRHWHPPCWHWPPYSATRTRQAACPKHALYPRKKLPQCLLCTCGTHSRDVAPSCTLHWGGGPEAWMWVLGPWAEQCWPGAGSRSQSRGAPSTQLPPSPWISWDNPVLTWPRLGMGMADTQQWGCLEPCLPAPGLCAEKQDLSSPTLAWDVQGGVGNGDENPRAPGGCMGQEHPAATPRLMFVLTAPCLPTQPPCGSSSREGRW